MKGGIMHNDLYDFDIIEEKKEKQRSIITLELETFL